MSKTIETNTKTILTFWFVPVVILLIWLFIRQAATGLVIIGISILLSLALKPLVRKVEGFFNRVFDAEKKYSTISAVSAYLIVVLIIGGIIGIVGPVVVSETSKFFEQLPKTFETFFGGWDGINSFGRTIGISNLQSEISNAISSLSSNIFGAIGSNFVASISGIADIVMKVVLVLVLTLLFLLEGPSLLSMLWRSMETGNDDKKSVGVAKRIVSRMMNVVSTYFSKQVLVALLDGVASALIVFILSLCLGFSSSLAIPMGMVTMVFYMIPMFGQIIGSIIVTLVLACSSLLGAAIFVIVYIIYAQIENNVIAPKIQGNALGLPAVMILCAMIIGMYMFGLIGAIIAIPIAGCIKVLVEEFPNIRMAARK